MTAVERAAPDAAIVESWLQEHIAALIGMTAAQISGQMDFDDFGIDSIQGVNMIAALEQWLGIKGELPLDIIFDAGSISEAARQIAAFADGQLLSS